jgi:hypothetical protein
MAVNLKLTHAIKDRVVQYFQLNGSVLLINFVDGSKMTVTIAECNSPPLHEGARIRQISEDQTRLLFECEDDGTLGVTIVDPGNSVILRDTNSRVGYLGSCGSGVKHRVMIKFTSLQRRAQRCSLLRLR